LSKGSGTFDIVHPDPAKAKAGMRLQHSFVESPTAGDNVYRWSVTAVNGSAVIALPDYYKFLNENTQVWISPKGHFGRAYGEINAELTSITITAESDGQYNVLAIGTRKDPLAVKNWASKGGIEYMPAVEQK